MASKIIGNFQIWYTHIVSMLNPTDFRHSWAVPKIAQPKNTLFLHVQFETWYMYPARHI